MAVVPTQHDDRTQQSGELTPLSPKTNGRGEQRQVAELATVCDSTTSTMASFVMRWLATLTIVGCVFGIVAGVVCNKYEAPEDLVKVLGFPGQLFIRALKVMVVPMIFCSMVVSIASVGGEESTAMATMAIRFYLSTTFVAAAEGVLLFNLFFFAFNTMQEEDSASSDATTVTEPSHKLNALNTIMKLGLDLVPDNLAAAFVNTQLLGVMTFATFFGYVITSVPNHQVVVKLFNVCNETFMAMIRVVICFTPVGVGSLVAASVAKSQNAAAILTSLGSLIGVALLGQLLHVFGVYSALYLFYTRRNPLKHFMGLPRMWLTAFGTSSSAATLSTTIKCCEDLGMSKAVISFVLPIGCTVNMDGSALERPLTVLWIAYVSGQPLDFAGQIVVALTASLMSIGGSPIPSAGVSTLTVMLEAAGVELTSTVKMLVAFALAIEWFLDSVRTTVNVTGDTVGAAIVYHLVQPNANRDSVDAQVEDTVQV